MQAAKDKEIMGRDNCEDDVFMPKDNAVILEDGEMNEIDRELEEFKLQTILPDDLILVMYCNYSLQLFIRGVTCM